MRSAYFYVTTTGDFERLQCLNFETSLKTKPFLKNWSTNFLVKVLLLKAQHLHTKLTRQKPMLRQIEWGVQNRPTTKNADLPRNT